MPAVWPSKKKNTKQKKNGANKKYIRAINNKTWKNNLPIHNFRSFCTILKISNLRIVSDDQSI